MATPVTVKPANAADSAARRRGLLTAYIEKVFEQLRRSPGKAVPLVGPLGPRSEILLGLKLPSETIQQAQKRIVGEFAQRYPLLVSSAAVDATV